MYHLDIQTIDNFITHALEEDLGRGDITSTTILSSDHEARFCVKAKESMVLCGLGIAERMTTNIELLHNVTLGAKEGEAIEAGRTIIEGKGNARAILIIERTLLNILQHLSAIATLTHHYVLKIKHTKAKILDTRKTIPGLRDLQKYAVHIGGGINHRLRLDNGVLIKDNHIALSDSIAQAVENARASIPVLMRVEIECETIEQVKEALEAKVDMIMLDNMDLHTIKEAVALIDGRALVEASGGINEETVVKIAETGVDYLSIGALTNAPRAVDMSLSLQPL